MPSLNIRRLDEETHARLRVQAAENGRSMEEEARQILRAGVERGARKWTEKDWRALAERAKARSGGKRSPLNSTDLIREDRDA